MGLVDFIKARKWDLLVAVLVLAGVFLTQVFRPEYREHYLLFHSLAETFSIVVACGMFVIVWNARRIIDNGYLLFLGIAYFFVAAVDLLHMLAYKGMGVWPEYGKDLPTQLWIAARYLQAASLLAAPLFLSRKPFVGVVLPIYGLSLIAIVGSVFYWGIFPSCFDEAADSLTPFKVYSEYVISAMLVAAAAMLLRGRHRFEASVLWLVVFSLIATILSELAFTFYSDVYGPINLLGHLFKVLAFYLLYQAIIVTALAKPYDLLFRDLKQSEQDLRTERARLDAVFHSAPEGIIVIDEAARVVMSNPAAEKILSRHIRKGEAVDALANLNSDSAAEQGGAVWPVVRSLREGQTIHNTALEIKLDVPLGRARRDLLMNSAPINNSQGLTGGAVCVFQDVTETRRIERQRQRLIEALRKVRRALEQRVSERTADFVQAIETLQAEVEARIEAQSDRQRLEAEVLRTSEVERQKIGHDLHDGLGQILTGTAFLSSVLHNKLKSQGNEAAAQAAEIERLLNQSVQTARSLARGLSPVGVRPDSLASGLEQLAANVQEMTGIACRYLGSEEAAARVEDDTTATHLYRIAQEAANNAFKHGKASQVDINLSTTDGVLVLEVTDNGVGIDAALSESGSSAKPFRRTVATGGMGLGIMNYRADMIGATLTIERRSEGGTAIRCIVPVGRLGAARPQEDPTREEECSNG